MSSPSRPWRLGLVGHPVAHSRSPALHHAALSAAGLKGNYALFDAPDEAVVARTVARLRRSPDDPLALDGLNVTIPHKLTVIPMCDALSEAARAIGAVNTLSRAADGAVLGDNTDAAGLAAATRPLLGGHTPEQTLVLGAGGAARAAVHAARLLGCHHIRVANRTAAKAEALAASMNVTAVPADSHDAFDGVDLVFQASSRGMGLEPASEAFREVYVDAVDKLGAVATAAVVVDLVYTPRPTPFVAAARALALRCDDGMEMLIQQAAAAFEGWTGVTPNTDAMRAGVSDGAVVAAISLPE